jgi:hypothetical protein
MSLLRDLRGNYESHLIVGFRGPPQFFPVNNLVGRVMRLCYFRYYGELWRIKGQCKLIITHNVHLKKIYIYILDFEDHLDSNFNYNRYLEIHAAERTPENLVTNQLFKCARR